MLVDLLSTCIFVFVFVFDIVIVFFFDIVFVFEFWEILFASISFLSDASAISIAQLQFKSKKVAPNADLKQGQPEKFGQNGRHCLNLFAWWLSQSYWLLWSIETAIGNTYLGD